MLPPLQFLGKNLRMIGVNSSLDVIVEFTCEAAIRTRAFLCQEIFDY